MTIQPATRPDLQSPLQLVPASRFYRVSEREFGAPGLVAIESVGPFVELAEVGPFLTIHDSYFAPRFGIGHHPHRANERLFYIIQGRVEHDDALNGIRGTMEEGDLVRLTEGLKGMLHQEWNGVDGVTRAFILVVTPDAEPPIMEASFEAFRAADRVRSEESPGVETLELIGPRSDFRANTSALRSYRDSRIHSGSKLEINVPADEGLLLYPLSGLAVVSTDGAEPAPLGGRSTVYEEGADAMAIAWGGPGASPVRLQAMDGGARVLRIGFARAQPDIVIRPPYRAR